MMDLLKKRASRLAGWSVCSVLILSGCVFEFSETTHREHGSVGAEVFRVVCMNLASQAYPNDLTGSKFTGRCEGTDKTPLTVTTPSGDLEKHALARYNAFVARRSDLIGALDAVFGSDLFEEDEFRTFLAKTIPLYDPPSLFPKVTREAAKLLQGLIDGRDEVSKEAIAALERTGSRDGYRPLREALGVARPALAYPEFDKLVATTLESFDPKSGSVKDAWQELLRAAALDLATADATPPDPKNPGTLALARKLMLAQDPLFSSGRGPRWLAARDYRGIVQTNTFGGGVPAPFSDKDGDGLADIDALGRLEMGTTQALSPFETLTTLRFKQDAGARDSFGRPFNMMAADVDPCAGATPASSCGAACDAVRPCAEEGLACGKDGRCAWNGQPALMYRYLDADKTLLAGMTRDINALLIPKGTSINNQITPAALHSFAYGLNALVGDYKQRSYDFGKAKYSFMGPDTATGPIFDLVYALGNVLPFEETDQLLQVLRALVTDHEPELAGLIEAALYIDERGDHYPDARWKAPHDFWDDVLVWSQRLLKRPGLVEAMLRALATDEFAKLGPMVGDFLRVKDLVSYPNGTRAELIARGIDHDQVMGKLTNDQAGKDLAKAIQEDRKNVNFPCQTPPTGLAGGSVSDPGCVPNAPYPAKNHKGIRGCPADKPMEGASCASAGGYGLCSWDAGSCVCDCAGGLCRGDMTPTWRCTDPNGSPLPQQEGFDTWVDRSQPDNRVGPDGQTNQSLFQRTLALVHDLHEPAAICNKDQAAMKLFDPAGSNTELLGGALGLLSGGLMGPFKPCEALAESHIPELFADIILGTGKLKIRKSTLEGMLKLVDSLNLGAAGLSGDALMERQTQVRGLGINKMTPQAMCRMVFSPANPFVQGLVDLPPTRDNIPIVYRHSDVMYAWEIDDPIGGASFYDTMSPLLKAFDEHELRDEDGNYIDGYLFGDLISMIYLHWPSPQSDAAERVCDDTVSPPKCDLTAPLFAYKSNGVSYEELMAEAFMDARILERVRDVLRALDNMEVAPGVDGINVIVKLTENLLDPTKSCLNGDCTNHPLAYRDGRTSTTSNTGREIKQLAPVYLVLDALNAIDKRFEGDNEKRLAPWREARSQLVDLLVDVDRTKPGDWYFKNPHSRPILLNVIDLLRERLSTYGTEQQNCLDKGGSAETCHQVRNWAVGLTARMEKSLGQPVSAATLRLLEQLWGAPGDPGGELLKLVQFISKEGDKGAGSDAGFDATLLSVADMLQLFEDTPNTAPVMRFLSRAIAPNAIEVTAKGPGDLAIADGVLERSLTLLRELNRNIDPPQKGKQGTLTKLLRALVQDQGKDGIAPLEVIIDVIAEVNRAEPGADSGKSLSDVDLRAVFNEAQGFLSSERHGLERLYDIIEARKLP